MKAILLNGVAGPVYVNPDLVVTFEPRSALVDPKLPPGARTQVMLMGAVVLVKDSMEEVAAKLEERCILERV